MTAELITPIDDFSGLPLPLMPVDSDLPIGQGSVANWHHHFHPASNPVLTDTLGGRALRSSRIQLVPVEHHNFSETAYHRYYAGPELPDDTQEQFGMCVLSCAGYTPDFAIDVSEGEPDVRPMEPGQLKRLRMKPEYIPPTEQEVERFWLRQMPEIPIEEAGEALAKKRRRQSDMSYRNLRYGYDPMKQFFTEVVLDQDVSDMPARISGDFLASGDEEQGMKLLARAALAAAETTSYRGQTVADIYAQARDDGRLHDGMPPNAASLIKNKLGDEINRRKLLPELRRRLLGADEGAA